MKLYAYALRPFDELPCLERDCREFGIELGWTEEYPSLDNAELACGHDALSIITNQMPPELLDRFWELGVRSIATRSIGYDHIALGHARQLGMRVAHASYPPEGVADYTIMLLLMAVRRAKLVFRGTVAQDFTIEGKIGRDLGSLTVGVVGTGRIGAAVVRRLRGFGCTVLAADPFPSPEVAKQATYVGLDELLEQSDAICLHAPGLPQNHHMIGREELARMRDGVTIVNTARGMLIDTNALVEAIEAGKVGACALDTTENEGNLYYLDHSREVLPNRQRAILRSFPNVIVSPHMAFYTETNVAAMVRSTVEALVAFSHGKETPLEVF